MNRFSGFLALLFCLLATLTQAQSRYADTLMHVPMIYAGGGFDLAGGDMAKRFNNNYEVGGGFMLKTKKNWLFGLDMNYLFGEQPKEITTGNVSTSSGFVIGEDGLFVNLRSFERGIKLPVFKAGRLIPFAIANASVNSGFFVTAGIGFLQHKIQFEDVSRSAPQLRGDYVKGYDRLTNGLALTQNLGYMYLDKRHHINFFVNLEFTQGFTKSRRDFDFDLMRKDTQNRLDLLHGIKLGWIFPIYKKLPQEYYYN